ncbi:MAG: ribonuclease III [Clostridia bacterium]|nr:ribonuclease III [Clostridia bacterium]
MERFLDTAMDPKQLSPLTLAYVGDGVYELFVRDYIVSKGNCPVKKLHSRVVEFVRCEFQAKVLSEVLMPLFTQEEMDICLRGRNAHVSHVPKNSSVADYHGATAFECVFGYLYLSGRLDRLRMFFEKIIETVE